MKEINYKNKKLKLPYDLKDGELSTEMVTRQNPFSGQSIQLPEFAAVIYDHVIRLNLKAERKGCRDRFNRLGSQSTRMTGKK